MIKLSIIGEKIYSKLNAHSHSSILFLVLGSGGVVKAEETLKQVYEQGEKTELRLLTELLEELRKEKLVKETANQGSKISDQMTLDVLKSKYEAVLKKNGGQKNEDIETLIKDLGKK